MKEYALERSYLSSESASFVGKHPERIFVLLVFWIMLMIVILLMIAPIQRGPSPLSDYGKSDAYGAKVNETVTHESPTQSVYLVIDLSKSRITAEVAGVVLRKYNALILADSSDQREVREQWQDSRASSRTIKHVYLLSAANSIGQTEVSIIAEEFHLNEDIVQRYLPKELVLVTDDGLALRFETDCINYHHNLCHHLSESIHRMWRAISGRIDLEMRVDSEDAASLYGAALTGPRILMR